jgi:hypothetical protein
MMIDNLRRYRAIREALTQCYPIIQIGGRHHDCQEDEPQRINENVTLAAFNFLLSSKPTA